MDARPDPSRSPDRGRPFVAITRASGLDDERGDAGYPAGLAGLNTQSMKVGRLEEEQRKLWEKLGRLERLIILFGVLQAVLGVLKLLK